MAGVLGRFSFVTVVVGLEKVVFREGNCQGNQKLRTDPA